MSMARRTCVWLPGDGSTISVYLSLWTDAIYGSSTLYCLPRLVKPASKTILLLWAESLLGQRWYLARRILPRIGRP